MQYKVITARNLDLTDAIKELEREVQRYLDLGWDLHGDIAFGKHPDFFTYHFVQPIKKKEK